MGEHAVADDAGYGEPRHTRTPGYAMVLSASLPCRIAFGRWGLTQFFSAQGLTKPTAKIAPGRDTLGARRSVP
eukprot:gene27606-10948_t